MVSTPDPAFDSRLAALREHLKQAREERGGCPSWEDLRADLLPGGKNREGRAERLAHRAICPYCESHVREWERSTDHAADTLAAVERGVVRGLADSARGLVQKLARRGDRTPRETAPARAEDSPRDEDVRRDEDLPRSASLPRAEPAPQPARTPSARVPSRAVAAGPVARMLVVEMLDNRKLPESVFLCAAALDAEVAIVPTLAEIAGDPDLALVCGIVLVGARPPAEWPAAVRSARALVPGRPVVLLAGYGVEASAGARRALGDSLLPEDGPAERLLLALDRKLR